MSYELVDCAFYCSILLLQMLLKKKKKEQYLMLLIHACGLAHQPSKMRKHWVRLWRKTLVLCHPIESCHVTLLYLSLKSLIKTGKKKCSPPHSCFLSFLRLLKAPSSILCLPEPPPYHTSKLIATQVARAVHGACKYIGAVVSHDPKVCFS